ncbi:hypothetical protein A3737_24480, partial [Oleiphilus sp. HI0065]
RFFFKDKNGYAFALALVLSLLHGCASHQQSRALMFEPPEDIPSRANVEYVPFVGQAEYFCGPSAMSMMLQAQGLEPDLDQLVSMVYVPERKGSFQVELKAATRRFDLIPYEIKPNMEDLLREVAAGNPVLVLQNLGLKSAPTWHYAVVVGYDLPNKEVILHSGMEANAHFLITTFERTWLAQSDGWGMVISAANTFPRTAEPLPYQKSIESLVNIGKTDLALDAYIHAVEHWPESAALAFGAGNLLYNLNEYEEANQFFFQATQLEPSNAIYWNNASYSAAQLGCSNALMAVECAITLDGDNPAFKSTHNEVIELLKQNPKPLIDCPAYSSCP